MLIRSRQDRSFRTPGPRAMPAPRAPLDAGTFPGLYLRSNLQADGTVPARRPIYVCPDIWLAGTTPVPDYTRALATDQSYASSSGTNVYSGQANFIYVRARNGAMTDQARNVTLYYAPAAVINIPSRWQNNVITTDSGQSQGTIPGTVPGAVGVCDATFLWKDPLPPPPGSDHYCLFAQLNDAGNSNPFPNVETVLDMADLVTNNLGWGWRNVTLIPAGSDFQVQEPLVIDSTWGTQNYFLTVAPKGWVGWDVEFYCSQADSRGNPIRLQRTRITQDGQLLGVDNVVLDGGWEAQVRVNLYAPQPGTPLPAGASVNLACNYMATNPQDIREAVHRGLVDTEFMLRLKRARPDLLLRPSAVTALGAFTWVQQDTPAVRAWWQARGDTFTSRRPS